MASLLELDFGDQVQPLAAIAFGSATVDNGKLFRVQTLQNATGKAQAESSFELSELWDLVENANALVFDTTSANSGWKNGAASLLESLMNKKAFYNALRHHICELIIGDVWICLFGLAAGSQVNVWNNFKQNWSRIHKEKAY